MQICYWCPFLTHIATIDAVKNSAISLKKYSKKTQNSKIKILNSFGEWDFYKNNNDNVIIHDLQKFNFHKKMPKEGFFSSRLTFLTIFFLNIIPIIKFIKKEKPDYLIIHLLTILPIILSPFLSKNTKIILRISGLPNLHFLRTFLWKYFSKYLYQITTPTNLTKNLLIKKKIFDVKKIKLLKDPVINNKNIINKKKEIIDDLYVNGDFYLSVGRLTKQKNFSFLIQNFAKNLQKFKIKKLIIIGTGEENQNLSKLILDYNVQNNIFLLGFKKNIYKYLTKCAALISTSNYEDPGFAIIEACYLKKKIISSIVPNGPLEMYKHSNMCYFYNKNDEKDFINKIIVSENDKNNRTKIITAIKYAKQFTLFSHYKNLVKLIR
jgi:glycosyltransferase involved in cell wall biosynthesis